MEGSWSSPVELLRQFVSGPGARHLSPTDFREAADRVVASSFETVEWLLWTLRDALAPGWDTSPAFQGAEPGSRLLLMTALYHQGSYRALEEYLGTLKEERPRWYQHVRYRYLVSERRPQPCRVSKLRTGRLRVQLPEHSVLADPAAPVVSGRVVCFTWAKETNLLLAKKGVSWIVKCFERDGLTPALPPELRRQLGL